MIKFLCVCVMLCVSAQGFAEGRKVVDLEFAKTDNKSLKLDLYFPENELSKMPVVIWIHGGGWQKGSKDNCLIKWMTEYGYVVASISYRLTDIAIFPAQIHDCKGAVRWLRANAAKYKLDKERIAVAGSSAGGQLAALLGVSGGDAFTEGHVGGHKEESSRVKAIIDLYGATDFILRSKTQPHRANKEGSVVYKLLGGGAHEKIELAKKASAVYYVSKDDPPLLVIHGDKDKTVLIDQSEAIFKAYKSANLEVELVVVKNGGHGGKAFYTPENKLKMINFLKSALR